MADTVKVKLNYKNCTKCGSSLTNASYYPTKSKFFPDGYLTICKMCLAEIVDLEEWASMDKFCQWADYPFRPDVWTKMVSELGAKALDTYVKAYTSSASYGINNWKDAQQEWAKALKTGEYKDLIPELDNARQAVLESTWGTGYTKEELLYLDKFYTSLCKSHNIITATQEDNARTLAKLSVRISQKISANMDIDKDIKSYTDLMKSGGFAVENVKNMSDFESVGELVSYLEKTGWSNPYYEGAPKDIVDETILNMQNYLRRIVMGESNLKETVEHRLSAMRLNKPGELDLSEADLDAYETGGFESIEMGVDQEEEEDQEMRVDET